MINQFAKISPVVDFDGYLLDENNNRIPTGENEYVRLKDKEIGICLDNNTLITFNNNEIVRFSSLNANRSATISLNNSTNSVEVINLPSSGISDYEYKITKIVIDADDDFEYTRNNNTILTLYLKYTYSNTNEIKYINLGYNSNFKYVIEDTIVIKGNLEIGLVYSDITEGNSDIVITNPNINNIDNAKIDITSGSVNISIDYTI